MSTGATGLATRLREAGQLAMATRRPWGEFLNPTSFSLPSPLSEATNRLFQNLSHFLFNYTSILLLILFLSLIYHPISMIVFLLIFVAWYFLYFSREEPITVAGFALEDKFVVAGLGLVTVLALLFTNVWVNVVVSIVVGVGVVCLHAVLRGTEDLVMDDQQSPYGALVAEDPEGTYTIM
ncbi:hypothetical protein UlMin_009822 [Ulmus minor]